MPRPVSPSRQDGLGTLVAPPPATLLLRCLVAPASMPALPGQSPLTIPSRRRARAQHRSRDACDANFQARAVTASSASLFATQGLGAWRDAEEALHDERSLDGGARRQAVGAQPGWRSDERLRSIMPSPESDA